MPAQPRADRRRPCIQANSAENVVVVVMTIEPTLGDVRAMPKPQQAWNSVTPSSDSNRIGSQSRRGRPIGCPRTASAANRNNPAIR